MPETVLELDAALIQRIKIVSATSGGDETPRDVAVRALRTGMDLIEARRAQMKARPIDRASKFRLWLMESKGYKGNSARTISSAARKAVLTGDLDVFITEAPPRARSSYKSVVRLWREYSELTGFHELKLDVV